VSALFGRVDLEQAAQGSEERNRARTDGTFPVTSVNRNPEKSAE